MDMQCPINLSDPFIDPGDNQFLVHHTLEIELNDRVVGHVLISVYDWGQAETLNAGRAWLARDYTYLGRLKRYLFDLNSTAAYLPDMVRQGITGPHKAMIIDDLSLEPAHQGKGLEAQALRQALERYEDQCAFVLLPNWASLAYRFGIEVDQHQLYFQQLGLQALDDFMVTRYFDEPFIFSDENLLP